MALEITAAARQWAAEHPLFVEGITKLDERGVRAAVFSSVHREIVRRALGLPPPARPPQDIDLMVLPGDFDAAADYLDAKTRRVMPAFFTGVGELAFFEALEAITIIGGDEVQLMKPLTYMTVGESVYRTAFTPAAAAARTIIETDYGRLPLVHAVDGLGMCGIMQRHGKGKNDLAGAMALLKIGNVLAEPYAHERAAAMGWDHRVWSFLGQAGLCDINDPNPQALLLPWPASYQEQLATAA